MIRSSHFPAILLACLVTSMTIYLFGAVNTVHAAQNIMTDIIKTEPEKISGKVTDVITNGGLNYAEIDTGKEKVWAAGPGTTTIKKGDRVTFSPEMLMSNFHSKALDRDFPVIYFIQQFNIEKEPVTGAAVAAQAPEQQADKPAATKPASNPGEVKIGEYLREATLDGLNVENRNISDYKGKPLIINVWASWCGPCRAEMGSLERLAQRYNGKEFNIIGITIDDYRNKAEAYIKQAGVTFDNFQDHKVLMEKMLGASFLPLTVLVDDQGRVIHKVDGAREWDTPEIIAAIGNAFQIKLAD